MTIETLRNSIFALLAVSVTACSKPYQTPEIDGAGYKGILASFQEHNVNRIRVLMTHGMCSEGKNEKWAMGQAQLLSNQFGGGNLVSRGNKDYGGDDGPVVQRFDFRLNGENKTIDMTFLAWGKSIDKHRKHIDFDNKRRRDDPGSPIRASLNHEVRSRLINECLIDAIVYTGPNGDKIRASMQEAVCDVLGGATFGKSVSKAVGERTRCQLSLRANDTAPISFISVSLGSKVLFDAVLALDDNLRGAALASQLRALQAIYMVSNQLPILSQADIDIPRKKAVPSGDTLSKFLDLLATGHGPEEEEQLIDVVAFSDPNDILGSRVNEKFIPTKQTSVKYVLTNVLVSKDWTYFGVFENPVIAHEGHKNGEPIYPLIVHGPR
ncbi:hypothetical protein [Ruegeria sp. HKCCD8929]|uniref:hypothetical protein n=1 Tax=Ruegeria sp. HKCCD8929 TaxID=2683006 RepID=UPI00148946CE|nr:hypothetical protein [Ruegeria sp. HKCCD8929]